MTTTDTLPATPVRERTTADVLRAAARYIEEHGWCQGRWENRGAVCIDGAFAALLTGDPNGWGGDAPARPVAEAYQALVGACDRTGMPHGVIDWNDTPGRTRDEVLQALRAAADAAEARP